MCCPDGEIFIKFRLELGLVLEELRDNVSYTVASSNNTLCHILLLLITSRMSSLAFHNQPFLSTKFSKLFNS